MGALISFPLYGTPFMVLGLAFTITAVAVIYLGALISSLVISRRFLAFRKQVPRVWARRFGGSERKRALGSFFGAYLVLFGARMANGCAGGHILSGNLQMAISSFVFMIFVMISAWITLYGVLGLKINKWGYRY